MSRLLYELFEVRYIVCVCIICIFDFLEVLDVHLGTSVHVRNHIIIQSSPKHHCVQYLYNTFTEHAVGLCRMCLLLRMYVSMCLCVIHTVHITYYIQYYTVY